MKMKSNLDDNKNVCKYDLVLNIIEHPDRYTSEELAAILADKDTCEIYNLFCKTEAAVMTNKKVDVDSEWEKFFSTHNMRHHRYYKWIGNRTASIAIIIGTSIIAVAAGIAMTVAVTRNTANPEKEDFCDKKISQTSITSEPMTKTDTANIDVAPILFEDIPLDKIMNIVASDYGVEVKFNNREAATLHLYYRLDPSLPLDEVVSQLNTFEQINISRNGNTITID